MNKSILASIVLVALIGTLTGCSGNNTSEDSSSESTSTSLVESSSEESNSAVANIEGGSVIGEKAEDIGLDKGFVIGTGDSGDVQITGVSFNGIEGISTYNVNEDGKLIEYTLYAEDIADDFENKVKKAVEGVKAETNEDLEYEEMEVNEGKNGATTIEALKKGNLYCYYKSKVNPDTYIQIMGNGVGSISMLIRITDLSVI